jgi:hypothetical protein
MIPAAMVAYLFISLSGMVSIEVASIIFNIPVILFLYKILTEHKRIQISDEQIINIVNKHQNVFEALGVENTGVIPIIPNELVERAVWLALPNEITKELFTDEPQIAISPNLLLSYDREKNDSELKVLQAIESNNVMYSFLSGMYAMTKKLKLFDALYIRQLRRELSLFSEAAQGDGFILYNRACPFRTAPMTLSSWEYYYRFSAAHLQNHIKQMKRICDAMNVDYDSMELGQYDPEKSTFIGAGSWGMVGLAAALSFGSSLNAKDKKKGVDEASLFFTYNNIANHFNMEYCTDSEGNVNEELLCDSLYNITEGKKYKVGKTRVSKVPSLAYSPDSSLFSSHNKEEIVRIKDMINYTETLGTKTPIIFSFLIGACLIALVIVTNVTTWPGPAVMVLAVGFVIFWFMVKDFTKMNTAIGHRLALLDSYLDFIKGIESPNMRRTAKRRIRG